MAAAGTPENNASLGCIVAVTVLIVVVLWMVRMENPPLVRQEWFQGEKPAASATNGGNQKPNPPTTTPSKPLGKPSPRSKTQPKKAGLMVKKPITAPKPLPKQFRTTQLKRSASNKPQK